MLPRVQFNPRNRHLRWAFVWSILFAGFFLMVWRLRQTPYVADPLLISFLEMAGSLFAFTYAANSLIRFRGAHDRLSLTLALGFVLTALIETGSSFASYRFAFTEGSGSYTVPLAWMVSRTLLAVLLVAAIVVEKRIPVSREPAKEIVAAIVLVAGVGYFTSVIFFAVPFTPRIHPASFVPRLWDLLPAVIFLGAAVGYWWRLTGAHSALDRALVVAAAMNVACHVAMAESAHALDAPFALGHLLKVASYAVVLGGALLDNSRLFEQVSQMAMIDHLTGLGNYRRLLDAMDTEIRRSRRSGRPFAVLLMDLDGLKQVNDRHGHLVGSRALKRLGYVLRAHSRCVDTGARYGGDEFALVLPEAGAEAAMQVAGRIEERLANDGQEPPISVSIGVAVFPKDGTTIEKLLGSADRDLYGMKAKRPHLSRLPSIAACL
ncbi:MAG: sensor domain-containing diguanylate cyclase [Candidatus Acidiferrales bacterium]